MRTATYLIPDTAVEVNEYNSSELRCHCAEWRSSKRNLDGGDNTFPIPVCQHMLVIQRQGLDRNFLNSGGVLNEVWVGWAVTSGGFCRVDLERLGRYYRVLVPMAIASTGTPAASSSRVEAGLVPVNCGRKEIAQCVAPFYAVFGMENSCRRCGKFVWEGRRRPDDGLENPDFRLACVLWGNDLAQRSKLCPACDMSDLIPQP